MKRNFKYASVYGLLIPVAGLALFTACSPTENSPGVEYMPDMYRSPAVEAYVDYGQDPFYVGDSLMTAQNNTMSARMPAPGSIPFSEDRNLAWVGFAYAYENTPEGYEEAGANLKNPIPFSAAVFDEGQQIFIKMCQHCHGEEGKGDGKIVTNGNYPPIPAYDGIAGLTEGKMFHTLTYGKGNMGSHASQLTKEERWKVIWFVKSLQQGKSKEDMMQGGTPPAPVDTVAVINPDSMMPGDDATAAGNGQ